MASPKRFLQKCRKKSAVKSRIRRLLSSVVKRLKKYEEGLLYKRLERNICRLKKRDHSNIHVVTKELLRLFVESGAYPGFLAMIYQAFGMELNITLISRGCSRRRALVYFDTYARRCGKLDATASLMDYVPATVGDYSTNKLENAYEAARSVGVNIWSFCKWLSGQRARLEYQFKLYSLYSKARTVTSRAG